MTRRYRVQLPQAEPAVDRPPFEETPCGLLMAFLVFLTLFLGTPFLLWLVMA